MTRRLTCLILILAGFTPCQAQIAVLGKAAPAAPDAIPVTTLKLRATAAPAAALRYRLLPESLDQRPGNAAPQYLKAMLLVPEKPEDLSQKISDWLDVPLAKLPAQEVHEALVQYRAALQQVELGARCERCDWELPLDGPDIYSILLPELQRMRNLGRVVALKARWQIASGDCEGAIRTLQIGFAMARHAAEGPTLINGLVGVAIAQTMAARVDELVQAPKAPNLYWALTSLPSPFVDLRKAMEVEMSSIYRMCPALRDAETARRSPEQWLAAIDDLGARLSGIMGGPENAPPVFQQSRLAVAGLALVAYPRAKKELIAQGRSMAEVEAMPVAQVVAIQTVRTFNELRDDTFKWFFVPYWQAQTGAVAAENRLRAEAGSKELIPLASLLLPAISRAALAPVRLERHFAELRVIEAVRMYAAAHNGQLPERLDMITEVPIPLNPITGKPFDYSVSGGKAVLDVPPPPGDNARNGARYELTFEK